MNEAKIEITGRGGMGVKLLSLIFSKLMAESGKEVSLVIDYAPAVSGSEITGKIIYSDKKIKNPIFEEPDIFIKLGKENCLFRFYGKEFEFDLYKTAVEHFKTPLVMNMLALGILLKKSNIEENNIKKYLPRKHVDENIRAIKYAYEIKGI